MRLNRFFLGSLMIAGALLAQQGPPPDQGDVPDEPGRAVARISVLSGEAGVRRSDSGEWVAAALNAPLIGGDSLSVAQGGAAEIQLDRSNFARLAGDSEVRLSELDNGRQQIQIAKGLVTWRVLRDSTAQTEISTPFAAIRPELNASVRIEVGPDGSARITVRHGEAEVFTQRGTEQIHEGSTAFVRGDSDLEVSPASPHDQWDSWNDQRDAYLLRAQSPRYVSQDIYGTEDLDNYGRWDYDAQYGNVWMPTVASNWAPYRDGQWTWEPFYGWTWVDYSPWGWAPFHYGNWYNRPGLGWAWFPGRRSERAWWRPALVGFVGFGGGGGGVGFGFGNIGWVPLAPYERYHPWYGRGWNSGRTVVVNNFNIRNTNVTNEYRNARFNGGVTAVSTVDFQRGNFRNRVPVDAGRLQQGGVVRGQIPMSASAQHMRFSDRPVAAAAPRADLSSQRFYSRTSPMGGQQGQQAQSFQRGGVNGGSVPNNQNNNAPRMTTNPSWQRFGNPQVAQPQQQEAGRQYGGRQVAPVQQPQAQPDGNRGGFYNGPSRQVQVAPPIVRERQQPASSQPQQEAQPTYQRGGSFGSPNGYRQQPQQQQQQQQQAPVYREAPRAAPAYRGEMRQEMRQESRPAPRAEAPRNETPRNEAPRNEAPRAAPASREAPSRGGEHAAESGGRTRR